MLRSEYPVHRTLHTLAGATAAGLVTSGVLIVATVVARMRARIVGEGFKPLLRSELSSTPIVIGGVAGGTSHSILDAIVHSDVRPFAPLSNANPFYRSLESSTLEAACVVLGTIGLILLTWHAKKQHGR
jgi:hypothetical protein